MDMTGEYRVAASREAVWEALNDPEVLKQSVHPGLRVHRKDFRDLVHRQGHGQGRASQGQVHRRRHAERPGSAERL